MKKVSKNKLTSFGTPAQRKDYKRHLKTVIDFNRLFMHAYTPIFWCGVPLEKNPCDLWIYHQLIFEQKPDYIVETGTSYGGSALFLSMMCDTVDHGEVITIDNRPENNRATHPRLTALSGSSISANIISQVKKLVGNENVLVILDSDHEKEHVLEELNLYCQFVQPGGYLIVEDTNFAGPDNAVSEFLLKNKTFVRDREKEFLMLTYNPGGYLKRIA